MDENEFRKTYDDLRELPCVFEKAILNRHCGCAFVERINLGEREGVRCTSWTGQNNCGVLIDLMRGNARFALHMSAVFGPLPHAKELKVQVGGLQGVKQAMHPEAPSRVDDISALIAGAISRYGGLEHLPFQDIVKSIAAFEGRRRRSGRRPE